ncbi:serpin family protein [Embleya sp. NBC_00896]|uniref:serpin family protein n=1 Tax=Embleya sp. NBC_00896 TaxID=2975961 RepID=UPI00386479C0|nr:serpin family protein [Embleya sp. NBC_00896]
MEPALREHAGTVRELASRWLDSMLSDPVVVQAGGDVVCSPVGLWLALGAVATGAEGDTAEELADLIGVAWRESAPVVTAVARDLAGTDSLAVATGVWSRSPLHEGYRIALPDIGFGRLADRAGIDAWVARATGGLIEEISVDVDEWTRLVLVNALALKARWRDEFDAADTRDAWFHAADGTRVEVPMMRREVPAADVWTIAGRDGEVTVVELPCAGEDPARVRFALGPRGAPPASVITAAWAPRDTGVPYEGEDVEVRLPRFELRTRLEVVTHLIDLGLDLALHAAADFGGMSDEPVHIDQVVQQSLIRIAEEGVEAAAVTTIMSWMSAGPEPEPRRSVSFDRPFACVVTDTSGYVPLFAAYQATAPEDAPDQGL